MKLRPIKANMNEIELLDGKTVLFSYSTPVAYYDTSGGFYRTSKKWSATTSRHINQWLKGANATEVNQSVLDNLV
jgi:hypothetical protein